jgi:cytidine deaminase
MSAGRERITLTAGERTLVEAARRVRLRAHAPYSGFQVGAALRTRGGKVFAGCNVENASLGAGICAERSAVLQAVAGGMRTGELATIAIYTNDTHLTPPCGMCLQVLVEFGAGAAVLLAAPGRLRRTRLQDLYPEPFTKIPRARARRR